MSSIAETIQSARLHGAHRPFGCADLPQPFGIDMTKTTLKTARAEAIHLDPTELEICDDEIPAHRKKVANKYAEVFAKMRLGQALKVPAAHTSKVGNAMRNWIRDQKMNAHVRSIQVHPDCADKLGRVWLMAGPQSAPPVSRVAAAAVTLKRAA